MGQFSSGLRFRVGKLITKSVIVGSVAVALYTGLKFGLVFAEERIVFVPQEKIVKDTTLPPILLKIAKCESNNNHYDKNGQVLINASHDIGRFQVNVPIWGKKAHEMGLNLADERDNETFARFLYENFGSEPWSASKKSCWAK